MRGKGKVRNLPNRPPRTAAQPAPFRRRARLGRWAPRISSGSRLRFGEPPNRPGDTGQQAPPGAVIILRTTVRGGRGARRVPVAVLGLGFYIYQEPGKICQRFPLFLLPRLAPKKSASTNICCARCARPPALGDSRPEKNRISIFNALPGLVGRRSICFWTRLVELRRSRKVSAHDDLIRKSYGNLKLVPYFGRWPPSLSFAFLSQVLKTLLDDQIAAVSTRGLWPRRAGRDSIQIPKQNEIVFIFILKKFSFSFHFIFIMLTKKLWDPLSTKCERVAVQIWCWELKELGLRTENFGVRKPKSTPPP